MRIYNSKSRNLGIDYSVLSGRFLIIVLKIVENNYGQLKPWERLSRFAYIHLYCAERCINYDSLCFD